MGGEAITIGSLAAIADHHKKERTCKNPNTLKPEGMVSVKQSLSMQRFSCKTNFDEDLSDLYCGAIIHRQAWQRPTQITPMFFCD